MSNITSAPVLITGGASGIGARLVQEFAAERPVIVLDQQVPAAADQVEGVEYLTGNITDVDDMTRLAETLKDREPLGGLVHCAAIAHFGAFADTTPDVWRKVLDVNVFGTMLLVHSLTPRLAEGSRVVLFSSGTAFRGPGAAAVYASSKAAVIGFGRSLAEELGKRWITVNMIAPGLVVTPMSESIAQTESANVATRPISRPATTDDFIEPVKFLLSEGASFVTGQTVVVDGGAIRH